MGFREGIHRAMEQIDLYRLAAGQGSRDISAVEYQARQYLFCNGDRPLLPALLFDLDANNASAPSVLNGEWSALGFDWGWRSADDWHMAPDTGKAWPLKFFGSIPYRAGNPVGDIRVAWEPSRLQQLISLALLAEDETHREKAVSRFEEILLSWLQANPPYKGINYISAMECGLRLVVVCYASDIIRPHLHHPEKVWAAVLSLVDSHASLIIRRLSLHSSAGNHTIAECAGLIFAGELFPEFPNAEQWSREGIKLLEYEASRQFFPDGGGIEQAFGYHLFITDLCNLVAGLLKSKGKQSRSLEKIVDAGIHFLSTLFSTEWTLPNIGDNDGGYALSPHLRISHRRKEAGTVTSTFSDSGYSLIGDSEPDQRLIVFDHGALGMAPSYGHGHSDCLSVYWREQDEPLLVDPGTFTYTGDARWRSYFRGVTAHNTVSVDREDQAIQQSAFMWSRPFEANLIDTERHIDNHQVLIASHSGYLSLGVRHYRALIYNLHGQMLVWDFIYRKDENTKSRELSLWWQLAGKVERDKEQACNYLVSGDKGACLLLEIVGGDMYSYSGNENGPLGWNSNLYGKKSPITTLETRFSSNSSHDFFTYISPRGDSVSGLEKSVFHSIVNDLRRLIG